MDEEEDDWMTEINEKLFEYLSGESLFRVLWYLSEEEATYDIADEDPPVWAKLKVLLAQCKDNCQQSSSSSSFELFLDELVEDTKRAERDQNFREAMARLQKQIFEQQQKENNENNENYQLVLANAPNSMISAWPIFNLLTKSGALLLAVKMVGNGNVLPSLKELVGIVNRSGGTVVLVGLSAVFLSALAVKNILAWYRGEISGARCAKKIIDSMAFGVGCVGATGGAALGFLLLGPLGTLMGGIMGGILSTGTTLLLLDRLTQSLFSLPFTVAEENAYKFLGVTVNASNSEVNNAFRKLCLQHHPDKGGNAEDFLTLQVNMAVIKAARGDL